MSCYRLRKIKNPIDLSRKTRFDKPYISIPDCKCDKCRKSKKNDWLVRSYFEFSSKPQDAFFVTLDFDDEHLPLFNGRPCFDGRIIHSFCEVLRQGLTIPFRYIITSDYGAAFARPHYHGAFIFDKGAISLDNFTSAVCKYWKYGTHQNIQSIDNKYKNPFKAFEYVCKYSLKDSFYNLACSEANFPYRYRSNVHTSIGFGIQCLDPNEFKSDSFIKRGINFLKSPVITKEYLKHNTCVYISPKNDGVKIPFAIPRFYEMKLMYDYHWDSVDKKAALWRNDDGRELQKIRHNVHYIRLKEQFLASRNYGITNFPLVHELLYKYFPNSPYNGCQWQDVYDDIIEHPLLDQYLRYKDYFTFDKWKPDATRFEKSIFSLIPVAECDNRANRYFKVASADFGVESESRYILAERIDRCVEALFMYDCFNVIMSYSKADYTDWQSREDFKSHMRQKIQKNPRYRYYLLRNKFKFSQLNSSNYVPHNPLRTY